MRFLLAISLVLSFARGVAAESFFTPFYLLGNYWKGRDLQKFEQVKEVLEGRLDLAQRRINDAAAYAQREAQAFARLIAERRTWPRNSLQFYSWAQDILLKAPEKTGLVAELQKLRGECLEAFQDLDAIARARDFGADFQAWADGRSIEVIRHLSEMERRYPALRYFFEGKALTSQVAFNRRLTRIAVPLFQGPAAVVLDKSVRFRLESELDFGFIQETSFLLVSLSGEREKDHWVLVDDTTPSADKVIATPTLRALEDEKAITAILSGTPRAKQKAPLSVRSRYRLWAGLLKPHYNSKRHELSVYHSTFGAWVSKQTPLSCDRVLLKKLSTED